MQLYLVQHGRATTKEQDPQRPLTEEGRANVRQAAELASRLGVRVVEIRHSDKLRAIQTAEAFAKTLLAPPKQAPGLGPDDDIHPLRREVATCAENLMIVGHLPFLGRLASSLICQDESVPVVQFHAGGLVRLDRAEDGNWTARWVVPTEVIQASTD